MKLFRNGLVKLYILVSKIVMSILYDKKYLRGKHFEGNVIGWTWCWKNVFMQKIIGINRKIPFPVSFRSEFGNPENIHFNVNDLNNFQHFGCYFQTWNGKIHIGEGTYIAPNVGLITQNHDIRNLDMHQSAKDIHLGPRCWIGMNSVLLPGVNLGQNTIVGAGSVVTKSFEEGNCLIAGNPARKLRDI